MLGEFFQKFIAFERKGLCIESIVVVFSDLISDYREILIVVNVLQNTANLIIRVDFTLLIKGCGHIHLIEFTRTEI